MALRWNSQTNRFEDVGGLVGNYQGTNVTQSEFDSLKQSGVTEGLAGSVVTDNGATKNADVGVWDTIKNSFNPEGASGKSYAGNVMDTVGTGINAATGLAGMYFAKKNYDLQKDQTNYLKDREAQSDMRKAKFAANAGNSASY